MENTNKTIYLLQHITALLARHTDQILLEQLGIGNAQYKILEIVGRNPRVSQRYIVNTLGQTEASISRQIKLLKEDGLITTINDPLNKRIHLTKLTPRADKLIDQAKEVINKFYSPVFRDINISKQEQLISLLNLLEQQICHTNHDDSYLTYLDQ